ncbi:hypothetical protein, partial [Salmonella enterica]|uniref:hypothetical protein n=1 Tax=Salmonella enterica TaxID=28901 RepID=UPI0020C35974
FFFVFVFGFLNANFFFEHYLFFFVVGASNGVGGEINFGVVGVFFKFYCYFWGVVFYCFLNLLVYC